MTENNTLRDQLVRTKEELVTRGRTTSVLVDEETGCCCLLGAVGLAVLGEETWRQKTKDKYGNTDLSYDPFWDGVGEASAVVAALTEQLPDEFLVEVYGRADDLRLDYGSVYSFNDSFADDEQVFELIDRAIEAA